MALRAGFVQHNSVLEERYDKLGDEQKQFYHQCLPFVLMLTNIGFVNEWTIPHIVGRLELTGPEMLEEYTIIAIRWGFEDLAGALREYFIGFTANVETLPSTEFMKRIAQNRGITLSLSEIESMADVFNEDWQKGKVILVTDGAD